MRPNLILRPRPTERMDQGMIGRLTLIVEDRL
jgi:hypothetical protein